MAISRAKDSSVDAKPARGRSPARTRKSSATAKKLAEKEVETPAAVSTSSASAAKASVESEGDERRTGFFWKTPEFLLSPYFYLMLAVIAGVLSVSIPTMEQFDAPMATVTMLGQASGAPNEYGTFGIFALARTAGVRGAGDFLWLGAAHRWFPLSKSISARILPYWFAYKPFITV
jgi:hypothetical protein